MKPKPADADTLLQRESLDPVITRALRGTAAFVAPLVLFQWLGPSPDVYFACIGAQVVALTDVRGAYRMRFAVLLAVLAIITASTWAGSLVNPHPVAAVLAMGAFALLSGLWRHLSWDYGPGLGVSSVLLFIIALALPANHAPAWQHAAYTVAGGLWGIGLQALLWPFRPQHGLRHSVAESWMSVSELFASMRAPGTRDKVDASPARPRADTIEERELQLREILDRTQTLLAHAKNRRDARFVAHLQELHLAAVRLGTRAVALNASLETLAKVDAFPQLTASLDSLLLSFTNLTRSIALTTITHRPENFALSEARLRRCANLAQVVSGQLALVKVDAFETSMPREILRQIGELLAAIETALRETVDRGEAPARLPARLPDISMFSLKTLSAWMTPPQRIDPVLVRHTLRLAALTMLGVALYKGFDIPRGYWIAFAIIVVLQPDYGSTKKRAGQRMLGTFAGAALATAFLWVRLPLPALDLLIAGTVFGFAYHQKRRYGIAVFFITIMLVLLMATVTTVHIDYAMDRLLCNLAGGVLALLGALFLWPSWERRRFPAILAAAIRANAAYLAKVMDRFLAGVAFDDNAFRVKHATENADRHALASLQRLLGDPDSQQSDSETAAAIFHSTTRITRAITVLLTAIREGEKLDAPDLALVAQKLGAALERLAASLEAETLPDIDVPARLAELDQIEAAASTGRHRLVRLQLGKVATELGAITLARERGQPAA